MYLLMYPSPLDGGAGHGCEPAAEEHQQHAGPHHRGHPPHTGPGGDTRMGGVWRGVLWGVVLVWGVWRGVLWCGVWCWCGVFGEVLCYVM